MINSNHPSDRQFLQSLSSLEIKLAKLKQREFERDQLLKSRDAEVAELRSEIIELRQEIEFLREQNLIAQTEIEHRGYLLNRVRTHYESSTSWRLTKPLRWIITRLHGASIHSPKHDVLEYGQTLASNIHDASASTDAARLTNMAAAIANRHDYQKWIQRYETETTDSISELRQLPSYIANRETMPFFCFVSVLAPTAKIVDVAATLSAVHKELSSQLHQHWEWLILSGDLQLDAVKAWADSLGDMRVRVIRALSLQFWDVLSQAFDTAHGDWVCLLDDRTHLRRHCLSTFARHFQDSPEASVAYTDDDDLNSKGVRHSPRFRCDANPDMLLSTDYLGPLVWFRRTEVQKSGGLRECYAGACRQELVLRLCFNDISRLMHVPGVQSHRLVSLDGAEASRNLLAWDEHPNSDQVVKAVADTLVRAEKVAQVLPHPNLAGACRVAWTLPKRPPRVGIIIPTRDNVGVLSVCLESLLQCSSYPDLRVVLVDNGSQQPETLAYLSAIEDPRVKVLRDDGPFNFSRLINRGAEAVDGDVLCLLNNDMQITQPDWLEEMVGWALQDEVAAVGARLWYGEGTLQHGGIVLGIQGVAGHVHKFLEKGQPGYLNRALLHQSMSAVTGACMVVRRSVFDAIGGFDESLGVAYNDVDFCLRARRAGWRNVWTPHAEMIHHESISRGFEDTPVKQARLQQESTLMRERWGAWLDSDPAYSPYLTLEHEDCGLAWPPRVTGPYITNTL